MKVDSRALQKSFRDLPRKQRKYIGDAIRTSALEGVRWARAMAPSDTGALKAGIHAKFEFGKDLLKASVEAAPDDGPSQAKALSVEFGRRYTRKRRAPGRNGLLNRGTTEGVPFMQRTQKLLGQKHKGRVNRAIKKAVKELGLA
jgi:hypothetical protein